MSGYAKVMSHCANKSYEIRGYVKPNAGVSTLMDTAKVELNKLTINDMVVFWGGLMTLIEMYLGWT
jgi:hypothetical protein